MNRLRGGQIFSVLMPSRGQYFSTPESVNSSAPLVAVNNEGSLITVAASPFEQRTYMAVEHDSQGDVGFTDILI